MTPYNRTLCIVIAAALFLLLLGAARPYQSDDVWSLRAVALRMPEMMKELRGDIHPPLYFFFLRGWRALFGESEIASRSLSVLFCLGAAAFVFAAAREQWGPRAGLLALAIFVTSPLTTVAAQLVRLYGMLALASAASMYGYLRLLRDASDRRGLTLYIAANILGSFAHVWFFFLLLAQGLVYLVQRRTRGLTWMAGAAVASLVPYALLWLPTFLQQIQNSKGGIAWVEPPTFIALFSTLFFQGGLFTLAAPLVWFLWRRESRAASTDAHRWTTPAMIAAIAILTPFVISFAKPIYGQRWTLVALPAFAMAVGSLAPRRESKYILETSLAIANCIFAGILSFYDSACTSRAAAEYLARTTRPGDTVIFTSLSRLPIDYYWDQLQPRRQVTERSFPAEIDAHPAYEGVVSTSTVLAPLRAEAGQITSNDRPATARIFYLHGFRGPTEALLLSALDARYAKLAKLGLACGSAGSYFQYISAYSCESISAYEAKR
jgi:Dolichyl-phosphate-mannose-protein mannosyltransferase